MKTLLIRSKTTDSAVFKVAETLHQNGYEVHLLAWDRQNNLNIDDYPFKIHEFKLKAPYDKFSALFYLPFWWAYELYFLLKNNFDIVHACDLDTLWPAIIAKSINRNRLFYTIYDFYAHTIPNGFLQIFRNVLKAFIKYLEISGIQFAENLFLVDKSRFDEVKSAKINNLIYIYNSPPDYFKHEKQKARNYTKIFYGGSITKDRGIELILEAIKDLDDIKLVIAGTGDETIIQKIIKNEKSEYLGWLSYKDLITKSLEADILFRFSDPSNPRTKTASPNKLFEAMMCGKPIIMNSEMGISEIIENEKFGYIMPYGDIKSLKNIIKELKNPSLRTKLGFNGRKAYENKYSWKIMEKRLLDAYS